MKDLDIIKRIPITSYLERKGIQVPAKGNICAFWRGDTKPSLHIDISKNCWYDHGTGDCGDVIDLVEKAENCSFKQAIALLIDGGYSFITLPDYEPRKNEPRIVVDSVCELQHPALTEYIKARGISVDVARRFCMQVHYHPVVAPNKRYFAIGFPNRKGCWELRNSYNKIATGKDLSIIDNGSDHLAIFEGFFDFLSYLEMPASILPQKTPESYAILNSVSNADKFLNTFPKAIKTVSLYLDADNAGRQTTNKIVGALKKKGVEFLFDVISVLKECGEAVNDINDLLLYHQQQRA